MSHGYYSKVTLPAGEESSTVLCYLVRRFPHVSAEIWLERVLNGKVIDADGGAITADTLCREGKKILYCREVATEPAIPFAEKILYQNDHLLVACKPHFLPVNPTGPYVAQCLVNRLRKSCGIDELVPINRIDRETAGIVLLSTNRETRDPYYRLFREGGVEKSYEALAECAAMPVQRVWEVESRMATGEPWFRMKNVEGKPNSRSVIRILEAGEGVARFHLTPLTGKTHQLRLHMSTLGFGILNDRYYPELQPQREDDFANPLQLIARRVRFRDPITGEEMEFSSERKLLW